MTLKVTEKPVEVRLPVMCFLTMMASYYHLPVFQGTK